MKKYYRICEKSICIDAESFPGTNPQWEQFETGISDADININCKTIDYFPEISGGTRVGEFAVSVEEIPFTEHFRWERLTVHSRNTLLPILLTAKHYSHPKAFR
jgi:hypothetical protein